MPTYDYNCGSCGVFEAFARMNELWIICPKCGERSAERVFSPPRSKPIMDIEPYLDENMGPEPVYITSRRQKAEELRKRGLYMKRGISDGYR